MQETNPAAERLIAHVLSDMIDEDGHLKMRLNECCCMSCCYIWCEDIIF